MGNNRFSGVAISRLSSCNFLIRILMCLSKHGVAISSCLVLQARSIFGRMLPGEDFLPRAPDPDEIAFDNQGTEPKQGDTFEGQESTEGEETKAQGEDNNAKEGGKEQETEEQGKNANVEDGSKEEGKDGNVDNSSKEQGKEE